MSFVDDVVGMGVDCEVVSGVFSSIVVSCAFELKPQFVFFRQSRAI